MGLFTDEILMPNIILNIMIEIKNKLTMECSKIVIVLCLISFNLGYLGFGLIWPSKLAR